jgi:hypothetical protein
MRRRPLNSPRKSPSKNLIPALSASPILPLVPPRLARARNSHWRIGRGWEHAGPPAISARLEIPAGRERTTMVWCRGSTPAPNARCTGGWWVHGSKGGSLPFRLRVPRNAGSAAAGCMNKTWHCHGAAKAASEIKTQEREAPPSGPLFVFRLRPCIAEPVVDRARADAIFEVVIRASHVRDPGPRIEIIIEG